MKHVISRLSFTSIYTFFFIIMLPWKYDLKEGFYQFFLSVFQSKEAILTQEATRLIKLGRLISHDKIKIKLKSALE